MKKNAYNSTLFACFLGYIVQAIINNFAPLLFITFNRSYGIELSKITFIVTINFGIQLLVDLVSVKFVDRIGYRASMIIAHLTCSLGLIMMAFLPELIANPYAGLLIAVTAYAIGGGLLEVIVSPVVEACPTDNKEAAMSLLHSFYCWGHVGVVILSTLFFSLAGIDNWKILACIWAIVPLANMFVFMKVPIPTLLKEGDTGMSVKELLTSGVFWLFIILMACAGSCEQAVSQWASAFAEKGLNISKTAGDLAGPMMFAVLMGTSRALYGKYGDRIPLEKVMVGSGVLCLASYLVISLSPIAWISLVGCAAAGFSVGIFWPGTFSMAAKSIPRGGTALFAFLALGGDLGCSGGPTYVGMFSKLFEDNLGRGILCACVFPIVLLIGLAIKKKIVKE